MYKYAYNNKYKMKLPSIVRLEKNWKKKPYIYAERSEAGNFFET